MELTIISICASELIYTLINCYHCNHHNNGGGDQGLVKLTISHSIEIESQHYNIGAIYPASVVINVAGVFI